MARLALLLCASVLVASCTSSPPPPDPIACEADGILREGDSLPDCSFDRLDGSGEVALSSLMGTPVVLNFWASWCLECLREMPELDAFADEHPEVRVVGVDVVGLQGETIEAGRRYFAERGVDYESLADRDGAFYGHFSARAVMPLTVIVSADGVILERRFGAVTAEYLAERIEALAS